MPGLSRKLLIFAAADGVFIQPINTRGLPTETNGGGIQIEYGTNGIVSTSTKDDGSGIGLEAHGIVGLLDLVTSSYLISIAKREQVAQIWNKPIFKITDVTLIPLKSKEAAEEAIVAAQKTLRHDTAKVAEETDKESDGDEEAGTSTIGSIDTGNEPKEQPEDEAAALEPPKGGISLKKSTTFVKNVVQDRGRYGRFASKWFTSNGSKESARRQTGMPDKEEGDGLTREQGRQMEEALPDDAHAKDATDNSGNLKEDAEAEKTDPAARKPTKKQSAMEYLMPRMLRGARLYFSSSGFYFSYEHDLSGNLAQRNVSAGSTPVWQRFDNFFFWNKHLVKPLIDAGQYSYVLPLIQGFVGQRAFSIEMTEGTDNDIVAEALDDPEAVTKAQPDNAKCASGMEEAAKHDFLLTLISRRSTRRAGLRYLRRGVDDEGSVANSVETEQILSPQDWANSEKTFSLLQARGSIPLFFSQSPYSFKPVPIMFGSEATNQAAFKKHFQEVSKRYGQVQCVSLVDKKPPEVTIGEAYDKHATLLNDNGGIDGKQVGFHWFDFHSACKGMRFDQVSILLDSLQSQLNSFGWIVKQNDRNIRQQTGILRTNCMDCLDRTNVVQSAVAGWALQQQLRELGLRIDLQTDPKTQWFNTLWADNGDAISKQYAGTSALKGDFTRTRKRNWTGALSDFSLTLNRYYNNIFGDYFLQLNIDYYLGNSGPAAFEDFETDMMSQDYALDMRHIRQNAIDTCVKIVLEDPEEELLSGWTFSCPNQSNTLRSLPFEECVLLLTTAALYFCRFDWDTEKVGSFERVDLRDITEIWRGAYITSGLGGTHLDETKNVGFALRYESEGPSTVRTNTRSLSVAKHTEAASDHQENGRGKKASATKEKEPVRLLAFKALAPQSVAAHKDNSEDHQTLSALSEKNLVKHVTDEVYIAMSKVWSKRRGSQHIEVDKPPALEEKDVISVADAKRSTGYMESLSYSLKKMVWS